MLINREEVVEERLAHLITLSKDTLLEDIVGEPVHIALPQHFNPSLHDLQLHTHIMVFDGHVLKRNDTSLMLPQTILRKEKTLLMPGTSILFRYEIKKTPGIVSEIINPHAFADTS